MTRLVLFDIDGTLIRDAGVARTSFAAALKAAYGFAGSVEGYDFSGRTDPQIALMILRDAGLEQEEILHGLPLLWEHYLQGLSDGANAASITALGGVHSLLDALSRRSDCLLGLLTGNIEPGARIKLTPPDLNRYFLFGAFGSDSIDREKLPPVAVARAHAMFGNSFNARDVVIIGDSVYDVRCGVPHDATTIAVASGKTSADRLRAENPTYFFPQPAGHGSRCRCNLQYDLSVTILGLSMPMNDDRIVITGIGALSPERIGRENYFAASGRRPQRHPHHHAVRRLLAPLPHRRRSRFRSRALGRSEEHPPRLARRADGHRRDRRSAARRQARSARRSTSRRAARSASCSARAAARSSSASGCTSSGTKARRSRPRSIPIPSGTIGTIASEISMAYDLHGFSHLISTGCTSSTDAIGYAYRNLKLGVCDYVITGGADATITEG